MRHYRRKALNEYGEQCDACGSDGEVEVHHIDGDAKNDDLENLIPLCGDCHNAVHTPRYNEQNDRILELQDQLVEDNLGARETNEVRVTIDRQKYSALFDDVSSGRFENVSQAVQYAIRQTYGDTNNE